MTAPASRDITTVAGRRVKIVRGSKSQTVNICSPANVVGDYDITYRLSPDVDIVADELAELADLDALTAWLLARDGEAELPTRPGSRAIPSIAASVAHDEWLDAATAAADAAITALVEQFLEHPYLHRVEHSLHTLLHALLVATRPLDGNAVLATGQTTQLVHKEWPETVARPSESGQEKRGSFDIGILAPEQVAAAGLHQFRAGRIDAPVVVEVGLDYGLWHLQQDADKLIHSRVRVPYLLHLSRVPVTNRDELEAALCSYPAPLRTAYAHVDVATGERRVKHLADVVVSAR